MNLQVQWTHIALQSLSEVLEYTYKEFGERQLRKHTSQIYGVCSRIATFPLSGKREIALAEATGIEYRSVIVIKEIKLIYTICDDILFIEFVKNTRMDDTTILARMSHYK